MVMQKLATVLVSLLSVKYAQGGAHAQTGAHTQGGSHAQSRVHAQGGAHAQGRAHVQSRGHADEGTISSKSRVALVSPLEVFVGAHCHFTESLAAVVSSV